MTSEFWTQEELDCTLNTLLKADSFERMNGLAAIVGEDLGRDADAVMRIMWGLAKRVSFTDYEPGPIREHRTSAYFGDAQMIKWATKGTSKDKRRRKGPADSEYMAKVLCLPKSLVDQLWNEYGPAQGRVGFDLKPKNLNKG